MYRWYLNVEKHRDTAENTYNEGLKLLVKLRTISAQQSDVKLLRVLWHAGSEARV